MSRMSELDMDRQRVVPFMNRQRIAVASLIGECEAVAASGRLTEPAERSLRLMIAETLSAFNMQHNTFDDDLNLIRTVMEQS